MKDVKDLEEKIVLLESENTRLEKENTNLIDDIDDLEYEVSGLESESNHNGNLRDEVEYLEDRNIYPRQEITLPELMKFEFLKENWDKITLEQLEELC